MNGVKRKLSKTFNNFFNPEKSGGILLLVCTVASLVCTNSVIGENYSSLWQASVSGLSGQHWVNDALMTIFFLLIGPERERELFIGELSDIKDALLPLLTAFGGFARCCAQNMRGN
ncbi:MAG: Na+/H+ antiporter NhaA [Acidobacteriota bacterium]|nr:Na+/H+ antiporter NhaA [Acidobacteriota bacterium]